MLDIVWLPSCVPCVVIAFLSNVKILIILSTTTKRDGENKGKSFLGSVTACLCGLAFILFSRKELGRLYAQNSCSFLLKNTFELKKFAPTKADLDVFIIKWELNPTRQSYGRLCQGLVAIINRNRWKVFALFFKCFQWSSKRGNFKLTSQLRF